MATKTWTGGAADGNWGTVGNWLEGAAPLATDNVYFYNNAVAVTAGLNQSTITLASLTIDSSYTGTIGTATSFLQISATNVQIGGIGASGVQGNGSGRLNINFGSNAATVTILSSAFGGTDTGEPPIRLLGTSLTVNAISGYVGVGTEAGDSVTCTAVRTGVVSSNNTAPVIYAGQGVTVTTWDVASGTVIDMSPNTSTAIVITGGTYTRLGSGGVTTLTVDAGTADWNGTGTIATALIAGTLDFSGDTRAKTVTNCTLYKGAKVNANNGNPNSITFTNGIILKGARIADVTIDVGYDRTLGIT